MKVLRTLFIASVLVGWISLGISMWTQETFGVMDRVCYSLACLVVIIDVLDRHSLLLKQH